MGVPAEPETIVTAPEEELSIEAQAPGLIVEAALDGGVMTPVPGGRVTAPAEGVHWLAVRTRSSLGTGSAVRWVRLEVDGAPPRLAVGVEPEPVTADGRSWVPAGAVVRARAADDGAGVAGMALSLGGHRVEGGVLVLEEEGPVTITARAVDRVGNAAEYGLDLVVDATPPEVSLAPGEPSVRTASGLVVAVSTPIMLTARDEGSGVVSTDLSLDGNPMSADGLSGPWSPGGHGLLASAVDGVGNRSETGPFRFTVDTDAPLLRCEAHGSREGSVEGRTWLRPPVSVRCTAEDDAAGVEAIERLGNDGWVPVDGPFSLGGGGVTVRARDRVGNTAGREFAWSVDGDPPVLSLEGEGGTPVPAGGDVMLEAGGVLRPRAGDAGCGVASIEYRIGGGQWTDGGKAIRFRHRGVYRLEVRACDALGNCSSGSWTVDVAGGGGR